jgi:probable HAF family extracellular repeat protein
VAPQVLQFKPVFWEKGEIRELPTVSGDPDGAAFAINDRGQAVGVSSDCTLSASHAVLWQEGTATDLGTLGDLALAPGAINNKGQVVGSAFNGPVSVAFLWEDGVASSLGSLPGDVASFGSGINDKGQVVGQSCDTSGNCRVFLWQNGVMIDLNTLISPNASLHLFDGLGINSRGEVVGAARQKRTGEFRAFLATPCDVEHAKDAASVDREGTAGSPGEESENSKPVLPEDLLRQLQQRTRTHHHFPGFKTPRY